MHGFPHDCAYKAHCGGREDMGQYFPAFFGVAVADEVFDGVLKHRDGVGGDFLAALQETERLHDFCRRRLGGVGRVPAAAAFRAGRVQAFEVRFFLGSEFSRVIAVRETVHHAAQKIDAFQQETNP